MSTDLYLRENNAGSLGLCVGLAVRALIARLHLCCLPLFPTRPFLSLDATTITFLSADFPVGLVTELRVAALQGWSRII